MLKDERKKTTNRVYLSSKVETRHNSTCVLTTTPRLSYERISNKTLPHGWSVIGNKNILRHMVFTSLLRVVGSYRDDNLLIVKTSTRFVSTVAHLDLGVLTKTERRKQSSGPRPNWRDLLSDTISDTI